VETQNPTTHRRVDSPLGRVLSAKRPAPPEPLPTLITPYRAAQIVRAWLVERYFIEKRDEQPCVWGRAKVAERGWDESADAQVAYEGGYEWTQRVADAVFTGELKLPGVLVEPYSGWLLSFFAYPDDPPSAPSPGPADDDQHTNHSPCRSCRAVRPDGRGQLRLPREGELLRRRRPRHLHAALQAHLRARA
jgi:hypothetical protein